MPREVAAGIIGSTGAAADETAGAMDDDAAPGGEEAPIANGAVATWAGRAPQAAGAGAVMLAFMFVAMTRIVEPGGRPIGTWIAWDEPSGMP
mmetsp:Transcript_13888/g.40000  ORF Transcript_13888/g.40000 Transcript_13888/m.40000 type:complete len:92 (+) Transcript_13888:558-833(+)